MVVQKRFETWPLDRLIPYENNPRLNDEAVADVAESIRQTDNLDPIEVDEDGIILSGHTRLKALKKLGYTETDVIIYIGLTDEQKRKYRLLANKTGEKAQWDLDKLLEEMADLDFGDYDFGFDLDDDDDDEETAEPEVEFTEELREEHNYVVLFFDNDVDWLQAQSLFNIGQKKAFSTRKDGKVSPNMKKIGVGRVLNGAKALERILNHENIG